MRYRIRFYERKKLQGGVDEYLLIENMRKLNKATVKRMSGEVGIDGSEKVK